MSICISTATRAHVLVPFHLPLLISWLSWNSRLAYVVYALLRGALTGSWPYPFLDPDLNSAWGVAANILGLQLSFVLSGAALALFDHFRLGQRR